jgi:hypothetical protein
LTIEPEEMTAAGSSYLMSQRTNQQKVLAIGPGNTKQRRAGEKEGKREEEEICRRLTPAKG